MTGSTTEPLSVTVTIGGEEYPQSALDDIYRERSYFTLHEMDSLGARLLDNRGLVLSGTGIDAIPAPEVGDVLLTNKLRLGKDRLNELYEVQYREADRMWLEMIDSSGGEFAGKVARAHVVVTGFDLRKTLKLLRSSLSIRKLLLAMEPDHIDASPVNVTEIMGMYGRPTQMKATLGSMTNAPEPGAPTHRIRLIGASKLTAHPEVTNAIAMHQMRFVKGGVDILAAAHFPAAAPQELVDGHSVHMGIEFSNLFRKALGF